MNTLIVFLVYIGAFGLALLLLFELRTVRWPWHLLSIAAALAIGFMPPVISSPGPTYDLVVGACFLILMVWGIGAPLFHHHHGHAHIHAAH